MSRTFRNRHAVPHGWIVFDGNRTRTLIPGLEYLDDRRETPSYESYSRYRRHKNQRPKFRTSYLCKETTGYRRRHYNAYRRRMKQFLRNGDYDLLRNYRTTGGWMSW